MVDVTVRRHAVDDIKSRDRDYDEYLMFNSSKDVKLETTSRCGSGGWWPEGTPQLCTILKTSFV